MVKADIDIDYVAKLANLELTPKEKTDLKKQLARILTYIKQINSAETPKVGLPQIHAAENITRKDEIGQSLSQKDALANAKSKNNGYFTTKGIFSSEDA